jgi:hypothetical protein
MRNVVTIALSATDDGNQTGLAIWAAQLVSASFQGILSDNIATGSFKIQASNDRPPDGSLTAFVPTNWADIPSATATFANQAGLVTIGQMAYQWVRVVFTSTLAGSGTVTVKMNALGI